MESIIVQTVTGKKRLKKVKVGHVLLVIGMLALVCFTALPMVAMICRAFMPLDELYLYPPRIIVHRPTFSIFVSCAGAYGLAKFKPRGSTTIFAVITAALMFSSYVTQIPNYLIVNGLGLVNSYWALILPKIAVAYNFFLVKQFAEQLPDSILEAARIDGAKELYTFWRIAMPLLKPAWSTLAVFSFVSNWNDYFSALVYINKDAMKTLPLALQTLAGGAGVVARSGSVGAATLLTTLPTIIIFCIMRGKVMQTMTYSGIKS